MLDLDCKSNPKKESQLLDSLADIDPQALHTPVVNIPGFKGDNGMPIGVSLVAPRYHDRKLLAVSKAVGVRFEAEGGWKRESK